MEIVQQVSSRLSVGVMEFRKTKSTDCYEKQKDFMMTCLMWGGSWQMFHIILQRFFYTVASVVLNACVNMIFLFSSSALTVFSPCLLFFLFKGCNKLSFKDLPVSSQMNPFYVSVTVT